MSTLLFGEIYYVQAILEDGTSSEPMRVTISDSALEVTLYTDVTTIGSNDRILFTAIAKDNTTTIDASYVWQYNNQNAESIPFITIDGNLMAVDGSKSDGLEPFQISVLASFRGAEMRSTMSIDINQPPVNGTCVVLNDVVDAFSIIDIQCMDWVDVHEPLSYNFELHGNIHFEDKQRADEK